MIKYLAALFCFVSTTAFASRCGDGREPDNLTRAGGNGVCLAIDSFTPPGAAADAPPIIYLHGNSDGGEVNLTKGSISLLDWLKNLGRDNQATTVFLQRPGFRSVIGKSEGFEDRPTSYYNWLTDQHLEYIAGALKSLRSAYPKKPLLLAGHSGGALLTSLLIARYPQLADAAVMSACPCDLRALRGMPANEPLNVPDPYAEYVKIPNTFPVIALTGDKDVDTPPQMGQRFIELLQKKGARNASFVLAAGHTHFTIRPDSKELPEAIGKMVTLLRQKKSS